MGKKVEKDYAYWERIMPELDPARVAERLEVLRAVLKIETKADMARRIGVLPTEYSNWLAGEARLTIHKAAAVARTCNVGLDYILLGDVSDVPTKLQDDFAARLAAVSKKNIPKRKS